MQELRAYQARQAERTELAPGATELEHFWRFFERINPQLIRPSHFKCYAERVLCAAGSAVRLVFAAPPQHGKTEVTLALIAYLILKNPGKRWAYVTYNQTRANNVARLFKRKLAMAGIVVTGPLAQLILPHGGQILFTSIEGGITGEPVDGAAFVDDPYKGRPEADSLARRELVDDTYRQAIEPRVHPGASIFVLATRWHPQDLSGTLAAEGAEYINLPAIAENDNDPNGRAPGEALFPAKWPLEELYKKREMVLDFTWAALYQGRPRPKGGKVYLGEHFYTRLPDTFRGCFGIDLAFSSRTSADWSVCIELIREDFAEPGKDPLFYVVWVDRQKVTAPEFALTLRARNIKRKTFKMYWRYAGTEKGSADFLREKKLPVRALPFPGDKLVCAQHSAPAWNAGRILVPDPEHFPECEEWLYPFLDILHNFTGTGREKDDDADALANAFDMLRGSTESGYQPPPTFGGGFDDTSIGL